MHVSGCQSYAKGRSTGRWLAAESTEAWKEVQGPQNTLNLGAGFAMKPRVPHRQQQVMATIAISTESRSEAKTVVTTSGAQDRTVLSGARSRMAEGGHGANDWRCAVWLPDTIRISDCPATAFAVQSELCVSGGVVQNAIEHSRPRPLVSRQAIADFTFEWPGGAASGFENDRGAAVDLQVLL